jgi:hypothetical protein
MNPKPFHAAVSQFQLCKQIYTSGFLSNVDLTPAAKLVLIALANHYNPDKKDMFPSQEFISNQLGVSLKTVQRAVLELKNSSIVVYDTRRVNHYSFTGIFFEMVNLSCDMGQNVLKPCVKMSYKHKHEHVNNNENRHFYSKKQIENTKEQLKDTFKIEVKSPMDDKQTAINWLNSLSADDLKHSFIAQRAEKVRKKWNIGVPCRLAQGVG